MGRTTDEEDKETALDDMLVGESHQAERETVSGTA